MFKKINHIKIDFKREFKVGDRVRMGDYSGVIVKKYKFGNKPIITIMLKNGLTIDSFISNPDLVTII